MAFEGGYTSAVNSQTERDRIRALTRSDEETAAIRKQLFEQQQQDRMTEQQDQRYLNQLLQQFSNQPQTVQPPAPGASSPPMMQGPAPPPPAPVSPFGPPGGQPPPMMAPTPPMPMMAGRPPQGAPPGVGGGMASPQAAVPPVPPPAPDSWKPMPEAPQGGTQGAGTPPPGAPPGMGGGGPSMLPQQIPSIPEIRAKMDKAGIPVDRQYQVLSKAWPMIEAKHKADIQDLKDQAEVYKAGAAAMKAQRELQLAREGGKAPTPTSFQKEAEDLYGKDTPAYKKAIQKHIDRMDRQPGTTVNVSAGLTQDAKELAARQYLATGQLPAMYRDAKGRAEIMDMAAKIQKDEGGNLADVPSARAGFKADAASLTQRQRFVDAGNQFIKNMQSQADLVDKYMAKGAAGGVPVFNKWIQAGRKQIAGDPDVTALDTAIRGLAREHQRIVTGVTSNAQLHVSAQETADQLLNVAQTPAQMRAAIKVMREEAENAVTAGKQEVADIRARMKGSGEGASPTPSGLREFKNLEDAKKAGMKAGMRVRIGGKEGVLAED